MGRVGKRRAHRRHSRRHTTPPTKHTHTQTLRRFIKMLSDFQLVAIPAKNMTDPTTNRGSVNQPCGYCSNWVRDRPCRYPFTTQNTNANKNTTNGVGLGALSRSGNTNVLGTPHPARQRAEGQGEGGTRRSSVPVGVVEQHVRQQDEVGGEAEVGNPAVVTGRCDIQAEDGDRQRRQLLQHPRQPAVDGTAVPVVAHAQIYTNVHRDTQRGDMHTMSNTQPRHIQHADHNNNGSVQRGGFGTVAAVRGCLELQRHEGGDAHPHHDVRHIPECRNAHKTHAHTHNAKHRQRQRQRQTDRQRDRETERQRDNDRQTMTDNDRQ